VLFNQFNSPGLRPQIRLALRHPQFDPAGSKNIGTTELILRWRQNPCFLGISMSCAEDQPDYSPHCHKPLEIAFVNFSFRGADMVVSCPNCAIAFTNNRTAPKPGSARKAKSLVDSRFSHILAFTIAAVITAAARHVFHTYVGLPREELRTHALLALGAFVLLVTAIAVFFRKRQRS
jgi:hypothetical protein